MTLSLYWTAEGDEDEHGLKKTIAAFNDGHVEVPDGIDIDTQTDDSMFQIAAKGVLPDNNSSSHGDPRGSDHGNVNEVEKGEAGEGSDVSGEAGTSPTGAPRRLQRRASVRILTPRKRLERGGYASLHDMNHGGEGDIELQARSEGVQSGEAVNPLWGAGSGQEHSGAGLEGAVSSFVGFLKGGTSK